MIDTNFDTNLVRRGEVTGVVRRRRWSGAEKGRIVAEAIAPGAVIAEVARRHDLTPQHLSNWIKAAKDGRLVVAGDELPAFVPAIAAESSRTGVLADTLAAERRRAVIEIVIGSISVRVPAGSDARDIEAVLRAARRCEA